MAPDSANADFLNRRSFLQLGAAGLAALPLGRAATQEKPVVRDRPTQFQIACMTLSLGGNGFSLVLSLTTRSPTPGCSPGMYPCMSRTLARTNDGAMGRDYTRRGVRMKGGG